MFKKIFYLLIGLLGVYTSAQTTLIYEDFSSGSLPTGWSNIDNGSSPAGDIWQFNDPGARNITAGNFSGNFAILDSDNYGSGNSQNATLETPEFGTGLYETITLEYDYQYRDYQSPESCTVEIYDGSTWTAVANYTTGSGNNYTGATHVTIDITLETGAASNAKVRFTYTGDYDWWWAIDNVEITATSPDLTNSYLGPGGVGNTTGTSDLRFWYDANNESYLNGASVNSVSDKSGYSNTLTAAGSEQPTFEFSTVGANSMSSFSFDGANELESSYNGNSNENMSFFMVLNYTSVSELDIAIQHGGRNTMGFNASDEYTDYVGGSNHTSTSTGTGNWEIHSKTFADSGTDRLKYYVNNSNTDSFTHTIENRTSNTWIGGNGTGGGTDFNGGIAEVVKFTKTINTVERIIVDNYLSAKYDIALSVNDFYNEDDNGDFDFNVAGIGRASDGSLHLDSQGTGIIRINTPSDLNNDEFLFWGEDVNNANYDFSSSIGTNYLERLDTKWRVSKRNDLGTVTVSVVAADLTLNSASGCNDLKLIVSSSSTFSSKTTYDLVLSSGIYTATGVDFSDNDYFTIEYIDKIVLDATTAYNGSGTSNVPDITDDCYKLLIKSTADGTPSLTENADVREVEVESGGKLVLDSGFRLQVTDDIQNDGDIRLVGTSQLLQLHSGASSNTGSGNLFIDQQGTNSSVYRYNYWSSPVHSVGFSTYAVGDVMKDGTTGTSASSNPSSMTFTSGYDGDYVTSPITISNYWIYKYNASWSQIGDLGTLNPGQGYTMKGPGAVQNYTFKGILNDGDYSIPVTDGDAFLLGNPYPSALDADAFLTDNSITNTIIDGTIYFWEHNGEVISSGEDGHVKGGYQGGYAARNIGGGVAAVAPVGIDGLGSSSGDVPGQYIPVGQGFFVNAIATDNVLFDNGQRAFQVENGSSSIFFKSKGKKVKKEYKKKQKLPSFRLGFEQTNSEGESLERQLLVVFKEGLSDAYDNGYDSSIYDLQGNDLYWKFGEEGKYVIAGLGLHQTDMEIPLEVIMANKGVVSFATLEKNDISDKVYLLDKLRDIYYGLSNEVSLILEEGTYEDRFFVTFKEDSNLAVFSEQIIERLTVYTDNQGENIIIKKNSALEVSLVEVYSMTGRKLISHVPSNGSNQEHSVKMNTLKKGVYVIRLLTEKGTLTKKIMVTE